MHPAHDPVCVAKNPVFAVEVSALARKVALKAISHFRAIVRMDQRPYLFKFPPVCGIDPQQLLQLR